MHATGVKTGMRYFLFRYFELSVWIIALVSMAVMEPHNDHASLCPLKTAGLSFCPGCGLGHSISYLVRGEFTASFHAHPLGWFAVAVILWRIITLIKNQRQQQYFYSTIK